jgi:hypothetical protein
MQNESEADKIFKEVAKRKARAEELGIKELISELYFDALVYYPHWLKNGPEYVCSFIKNAVETIDKKDVKRTNIKMKDKDYVFFFKTMSFSTPDGEYHTHGDLDLFLDNKKILGLDTALEAGAYDSTWKAFQINAFIEGDWIKDFTQLQQQIEIENEERERRKKEAPEKIMKLKEDFGIE